jgi:diadenosine tetraphosphate (Ap4A) HIT family hydrolase
MVCAMCDAWRNRRRLYSTVGLTVVADGFPIVPGHSLLLPASHVFSFATDRELAVRVDGALRWLIERFGTELLVYEHGNAGWNRSARLSVDHAHLHIVPTSTVSLADVLLRIGGTGWTRVDSAGDALARISGLEYHLLGVAGGPMFFTTCKLPSQAFRAALAVVVGRHHWNWKAGLTS